MALFKIDPREIKATRRGFLAGAGGLVVAVALPARTRAQSAGAAAQFDPNAFIRIGADNIVTVLCKHIEFGQGPWTGLATIAAEELDADWAQVRAEHAPSNPALYGAPGVGMQITGGSTSIATSYDIMRKAGATARAMIVAAAAKAWDVPPSEISVSKGVVSHASGKSDVIGAFADAAAEETPPQEVSLKSPEAFTLIGDARLPKLDTAMKSTGEANFALDIYRYGMLTAVVAHAPRFGATPASFDDSAARAVSGVVDVKKVSSGVAVLATNAYAAMKARKALDVSWDESGAERRSSDEILEECRAAAREPGLVAHQAGDAAAAFESASDILEAEYLFPYLAHAPMEPLDAVIERRADGGVEAWSGSQSTTGDHQALAQACGLDMSAVKLNVTLAGGSFGRRATAGSEFMREAAEVFMAAGGETPVKLMWTREDDIQGGFYRPITVHRMRGGLNAEGEIVAWENVIAGQSFVLGTMMEPMMAPNGLDTSMVEGASEIPYGVANANVTVRALQNPVPTLWWRSVGHTHTGYAVETFVDELLAAGGKDAVEGRLALMTDDYARLAGTLARVAEMADWGRRGAAGTAFGVASVKSFGSYVSQIAEVSVENGAPKVHKVWCAVDCGIAVNPEIIVAQMEGGIGYGLNAVLFNEIHLDEGRVRQSNFHDYRALRISEMPEIEVAVISSAQAPTGVGEPGLPPIGPAVANAVRRLTGTTPRRLPMLNVNQA